MRPPGRNGDRVDRDAQDHRADVLGGRRLEQVGATAGAVADVVADEVRDHARVARVVLGDALLDLADEVRPDVGGLGVDAAAELGEQRDERGPEAEPDDQERRLLHGHVGDDRVIQREDAPHAEERKRDDEEPGDGPAAHRDLDGLDEAAPCRGRGPNVGPDGDEHADDAGGHRTQRADEEGEGGHQADGHAGQLGHVRDFGRLHQRDDDPDDDGADDGQDEDRRVLAPDEGDGTLEDRAGDFLHRLGPRVTRQHVAREVDGEQDRDDARDRDEQLECTGVHGRMVPPRAGLPVGAGPGASNGRRGKAGEYGASGSGPFARWTETLQAAASVASGQKKGQRRGGRRLCSPTVPASRASGGAPILPTL